MYILTTFLFFAFSSLSFAQDAKNQGAENAIQINNCKADVVSYTNKKGDKDFLEGLKKQYNGIGDTTKMGDLLQKQEYIEVLNHLWTEPDGKKRLAWLEENVNKQHPILLFELAEEYYNQDPTTQNYILKVRPLLIAGMVRTAVDTVCTSDASVSVAPKMLLNNYQERLQEELLAKTSKEDVDIFFQGNKKKANENIITSIEQFLLPISNGKETNLPSPSWVFAHGMACFLGTQNTIPESDWPKLRKQKAERLIDEMKAAVNDGQKH